MRDVTATPWRTGDTLRVASPVSRIRFARSNTDPLLCDGAHPAGYRAPIIALSRVARALATWAYLRGRLFQIHRPEPEGGRDGAGR